MLISTKQHQANFQNAQQSTGPKTPAGKETVCLNALTWGLRARRLMLSDEDPAEYQELSGGLHAEWQPQTYTERIFLEQMAIAQWLLMRVDRSESEIYSATLPGSKRTGLLDRVASQRARLERSFSSSLRDLKEMQRERAQKPVQPGQPHTEPLKPAATPVPKPAQAPFPPPPAYVMAHSGANAPLSCAPLNPDSR